MVKNPDNFFLIHVYGDSLSLPRNADGVPFNLTYPELLKDKCQEKYTNKKVYLYNWSRGDATIETVNKEFKRESFYFTRISNVLIIQVGVCDCAPRPIPERLKRYIGATAPFMKRRLISFIHNNRAKIQRVGIKWQYVRPEIFSPTYNEFITDALKEFERIYIINIAPTTPKIEKHSPGFQASINMYNQLIAAEIKKIDQPNVYLIDINKLISSQAEPIENFINEKDGHHITVASHKLYTEAIWEIEKKIQD